MFFLMKLDWVKDYFTSVNLYLTILKQITNFKQQKS